MKVSAFGLGTLAVVAPFVDAPVQEIRIGATLSTGGSAASTGLTFKNTFQPMPKEIDGVPVSWMILGDAIDTTVLSSGSSGSSKSLASGAPLMAARRLDQPPGRLKVFGKYPEHLPGLAEDVTCATPHFDTAKRCLETALPQGGGDEGIAVVFKVIEEMPRERRESPRGRA